MFRVSSCSSTTRVWPSKRGSWHVPSTAQQSTAGVIGPHVGSHRVSTPRVFFTAKVEVSVCGTFLSEKSSTDQSAHHSIMRLWSKLVRGPAVDRTPIFDGKSAKFVGHIIDFLQMSCKFLASRVNLAIPNQKPWLCPLVIPGSCCLPTNLFEQAATHGRS